MRIRIVRISPEGVIKMVYSDDMLVCGERHISRLSDVEPDINGNWTVRFHHKTASESQVFRLRKDALDFEFMLANQYIKDGSI